MTLRLTLRAAADLENIHDFIARDNVDAALKTIQNLFEAMDQLTQYPRLGRAAEFGTRKLIHSPFIIVYRIVDDIISIETVLHGRRIYN